MTTRTPNAVSSVSGGPSSSPRRLLSRYDLLQNSTLIHVPAEPPAPQPAPPACATTAVAVPHRIRLVRLLLARPEYASSPLYAWTHFQDTHRTTSAPSTYGSPSPSLAPRSLPPPHPPPSLFAPALWWCTAMTT
ncbi:hypothetical protein C8J57DRAFT_1527781 [Mycena rebaudengoi]|nr:hypothetical protein C8J57DRAFT_1527781 [Mycena rebaudengoi]